MKALLILLLILMGTAAYAQTAVKVKDFCHIEGLKENQIMGYGIVVGLAGSGDTKLALTQSTLKNLLKNIGISDGEMLRSRNAAAVLVTAKLPAVVRVGDRIDVTVASIGDAKSLEGGVLLQSPLRGADDAIYAVAQGALSFRENTSGRRTRLVRTSATVPTGGIVERGIETKFLNGNSFSLVLGDMDFSVADELSKMIVEENDQIKTEVKQNGVLTVTLPADVNAYEFIAALMDMEVTPKYRARVVINEKDATIVMGADVKISEAVVARDGMTVRIDGRNEKVAAAEFKESATVKDLVDTLNYINLPASDLIAVLKALKDAGALHAELVIK